MLATNVCIWLSVLIEETKHELENATFEPELFRVGASHDPAVGSLSSLLTGNDTAGLLDHLKQGYVYQSSRTYYIGEHDPITGALLRGLRQLNMSTATTYGQSSCRARTTVGNVLQQVTSATGIVTVMHIQLIQLYCYTCLTIF